MWLKIVFFHQFIRYYNTIILDRDMTIWMFRVVTTEISLKIKEICFIKMESYICNYLAINTFTAIDEISRQL
jgi:hypothetical protein